MPLRKDKTTLTKFPDVALPDILRLMTLGIARTTSTDPAMAGTALLSAVSYCFSGIYRMRGKEDHTEPLNLYSLILAEPSELKSPVIHFVRKPFHDFEKQWNETHRMEIYTAQEQRKTIQRKIDMLQKDCGDPKKIAEKQAELDNFPEVDFRRISVDDITPESLTRVLFKNQSLLMISDEAGMFGNFGGRYSSGIPNVDLLLKCWNGEGYISDRVIAGTMRLDNPYLSICLAAQPYVFENLIKNQTFHMSGLVARFLYCFPISKIGRRKYNTPPLPEKVQALYHQLVQNMLTEKFSKKTSGERFLQFDEEASECFSQYFEGFIEPIHRTEFAECRDWGGKYHGLILRLCGLLHCVSCFSKGQEPERNCVDLQCLQNAILLADYYKEQAKFAYGLREIDNATIKAEYVLKKIKRNSLQEIRQSELYCLCRCKLFRNAEEFGGTLAMLEEYGYCKREPLPTKGSNRSGIKVTMNPKIYEV